MRNNNRIIPQLSDFLYCFTFVDKERCCFYLFLLGGGHLLEKLNFVTLGYSSKSSLQKELFPKYILDLFLLPWKFLEAAPFLVKFKSSVHA